MSSNGDEEMDIADWLAAIHLERYQESFKKHGYYSVKDILSLDNEILQEIGVGATGHRKRIISRLRHISGEVWPPSGLSCMDREDSQEGISRNEKDNAVSNKTSLLMTNEVAENKPSLQNLSESKTTSEPTVKPVPKPRTVFNKTANTKYLVAPSSETCLENVASTSGNIFVQEGFVSIGSSLDSGDCTRQKPEGVGLEVGTSLCSSARAGKPFHPFPSLPMRQNKKTSLPGLTSYRNVLQMEADTVHCSPISGLPSFAGTEEEVTSFSTNATPIQETLTMISNEIYSGLSPGNGPLSDAADTETHRSNMNLKKDTITQEVTSPPNRLKLPQRRNSASLKPAQMRNTSSPTPGWIRDGVSPRPPPIGNSASPRTPRMRSSGAVRPMPVGTSAQLTLNQGKNSQPTTGNISPITYTAASLRPTPLGDSGSPRMPRVVHTAFPRPSPIGHSASPRLPRLKNPSLLIVDRTKHDDLPGTTSMNVTSSKFDNKKQSTSKQGATGNTSLQRQLPVMRNTFQRPTQSERKNSAQFQETLSERSPRPSPVGNAGTGNICVQKSSSIRYTTPPKLPVLRSIPSAHSSLKAVSPPKLDEEEKYTLITTAVTENHVSKRPAPMGISPSSTLKKSLIGVSVPKTPSPRTTIAKNLLTPKLNLGKLGILNQGSPEKTAISNKKQFGIEPKTKCVLNAAAQKSKGTKNDLSPRSVEVEQCSTDRTKAGGSKLSPKQKNEKYDLSIRKSAGSVTFQRPKQTGNVGLQLSKCRDVVARNSQSSVVNPVGNAQLKSPTSNTCSPLSKVIKTIPSAKPKQKDAGLLSKTKPLQNNVSARPQPLGNTASGSSKPHREISTDNRKPAERSVTAPQKTARQLLPKLPFMQKKTSPKTALTRNSLSRAGDNDYLICGPGKKNVCLESITLEEDTYPPDVLDISSHVSIIEDDLDLHKDYDQSWEMTLTEKSLESALSRASSSAFKPIQNEHLVLVRPRLRGPNLNDSVVEQQLWTSKAKEGCSNSSDLELPVVPERPLSSLVPPEPVSPYCEAVFSRQPQTQEPKQDAKNTKVRTCATMPMFAPGEEKNNPWSTSDQGKDKKNDGEEERSHRISQIVHNELEGYSTVDAPPANNRFSLPSHLYKDELSEDLTISPYASFTSLSDRSRPVLCGWLDKLSPQGNYVFQRRFVKFDGQTLMYFSNDKELYPKGVIPLNSIEMARSAKENKFEVVTKHRIFVFRAESEAQRAEWCSVIQNRVKEHCMLFPRTRPGCSILCKRSGYLELKGYKSRIFAVLTNDELWIHKNEQLYKMGIGMFVIEMHGSTIRCARNKTFELITPQKTFSFTAESEREKKEWMEALLECISESLSDYEVAEKIWSNKANKMCADCKACNPDWASINLCVVICKQCAGQHRSFGTNVSKVQSLKLDTSIWSNEIVQLFIILGNDRANRFWAARLLPSEALNPDDRMERRRDFITQKYREGRYRGPHPLYNTQEEILKVLSAAVTGPNLLKSVMQFFCEAESVADPLDSSPLSMQAGENWKTSTTRISIEGQASEDSNQARVYDEIMQPVVHSGYLNKTSALSRTVAAKKTKDEFYKNWCVLERSLIFYENDKCSELIGKIAPSEVVCMGVNKLEALSSPSPVERYRYTFEIILSSEKMHLFGADTSETIQSWISVIGKWFTPLSCHCLLGHEFQRVGKMRYKAMLNPEEWMEGFFLLRKCHLFICPEDHGAAEDSVNLRQLQELTVSPVTENAEKKEILILVEKGRTLYLQGITRADFLAWSTDIQTAACGTGNVLRDQQLSRNDIPIIVDSCIAFLTQYGLCHEGIYRKNGAKSRIKLLMDEFRKDARNVKLRISDNFIEDVTDVLKRFFRELDDPIFTTELHPKWKEAAGHPEKSKRLDKYIELINQLPKVNRATLTALIGHLYRVQKCADLNQMCTKNLALLFAPSLFQTDGKGEHEVKVMEDIIDNYAYVFSIDEEHVTQMELENSLITTWKDVQLSQAGDLIIEVYLEKKLPDCCVTLKVSPVMTAEELTNQVLDMRNIPASLDIWLTFEVFENGELERPLHPKEKVLEQALQWCKLAEPSSAYLLVKKVPIVEGSCLFTGAKRETPKCGLVKCREESPKLLGCKFQERYFVIRDRKLLLLKEKKSAKPEREWPLENAKVYMGIRKKMKPPSPWGFTIYLDKQQLCLCCNGQLEMWDWITSILKAQHDDLRPVVLRRHSSSDVTKQKFGTMPLVPIRGDDTNATMVTANQTLRRLHTRRTLSMFFPMKVHQDSLEELQERHDDEGNEPVYEEVGNYQSKLQSDCSHIVEPQHFPPLLDRSSKPSLDGDQKKHTMQNTPDHVHMNPCSLGRSEKEKYNKTHSLDRNICVDNVKTLTNDTTKLLVSERGTGGTFGKTASLERQLEPNRTQTISSRSQGAKSALDLSSLPLFFEPSSDPLKNPAWKKSLPVSSNMQDKLLQELSTIISKKNEASPESSQQVT